MSGRPGAPPRGREVRVERDGPVALVVIDRPGARNALAPDTVAALGAAVDELRADPAVRAVVVCGGGGRFIAGGDLKALETLRAPAAAEAFSRRVQEVLAALADLPVPVIAAIDAFALGGGAEVALAADLRVAAADARIGFRQIDFAVTTGWGGARRLARLVGGSRALDLLWGGAEIDADEARRLGLVDRVAPPGMTARDAARDLARELAARPPAVVAAMKTLVRGADLDELAYRDLEAGLFARVWTDEAHWRAVEGFWRARRARRVEAAVERLGRGSPAGGRFIVFEGIDGAGTTTQARLLARWLRRRGRRVHETAEPSTGPVGTLLRQALAGRVVGRDGARLSPETIALLFAADRADHLRSEIEPALASGADVVCDRYDYSSLAYQGTETDPAWVATINAPMRRPDLVILLRIDADRAAIRRARRAGAADLYEVDDVQRRVAAAYDRVAEHRPGDRLVVVDGAADVRRVHRACRAAVEALESAG